MVGRTHREAPEIDGVVRLVGTGDVFARPGALVPATVCGVEGPDLDARAATEPNGRRPGNRESVHLSAQRERPTEEVTA
jgi:hypothetical protein